VEKDLFNKVLHKYPASTAAEAQGLLSLKEKFPYSQLLHVLTARVTKDHGLTQQQTELQQAAVYAVDRTHLKSMMSNPEANGTVSKAAIVEEPVLPPQKEIKPKAEQETTAQSKESSEEVPGEGNDLADIVIRDVKELYETRHHFEAMFVDSPGANLGPSTIKAEDSDSSGKSKRERIIELSKALSSQQQDTANEEVTTPKRKREPRKEIIDEIVDTKNQIEPENEKQKEQIKIIENFIKTQPSISSAKDKPAVPEGDLSTIKAGEFGDNIVSETLVELLLKQGKKDKAIEVLKKLIWKFPQKKAYFAAQIEELKK
jgi:hypothetical protein